MFLDSVYQVARRFPPLSLGFVSTSRDLEMRKTLTTVMVIKNPGGITHHQAVRQAPDSRAVWRIVPQLYTCGGPRPRKLNVASAVMA